MNITDKLIGSLGDAVKGIYIRNELTEMPQDIIILDGITPIKPHSICIGTYDEIASHLKKYPVPKGIVFFTPVSSGDFTYSKLHVNIIETSLSLATLYNRISSALNRLKSFSEISCGNATDFDTFFSDIVAMNIISSNEIKDRMKELPSYFDYAFNIIVVITKNTAKLKNSFKDISDDILKVIPTSNTTFYSNRLVIMYHSPGRAVKLPSKLLQSLEAIMEKYDAYAAVSNHTHNFEMIRTEYIIANNILNIALQMYEDTQGRVFTQEEYGLLYNIDLCYRQFEQTFHHNNVLYLTHPGLAALIRYDDEHNTNMREVLQQYLLNDRNLTKTSSILYMHRNTTLNKINRIQDIVEDNLDDPIIRQRLLFSCMLYDYYTSCKQKTFTLLPADTDDKYTDR